ncbi:MAG: Rrf2 family transcriptional regulator, partial [bacterium]
SPSAATILVTKAEENDVKSSSKFVVAVHILAGLTVARLKEKQQCVSSHNIAWSVNTNPVVIRRLLAALKHAGLVTTEPGSGGGTRIARSPDQITLFDIYQAVEDGRVFHYHYNQPNPDCPIGANIQDALTCSLDKAEAALKRELSRTTLTEIAQAILQRLSASA